VTGNVIRLRLQVATVLLDNSFKFKIRGRAIEMLEKGSLNLEYKLKRFRKIDR
jgi:hypothetical protein